METKRIWFHKRPMLGAAIGTVLGVLLGTLIGSPWIAAAAALLCAAAGVFIIRKRVGWGLLLFSLGLLLLRTALIPHERPEPGTYTVSGTVAEQPTEQNGHSIVILRDVLLDETPLRSRIRVSLSQGNPVYGDRIRA